MGGGGKTRGAREEGGDDTLSFKMSCALTECELSERRKRKKDKTRRGRMRGDEDRRDDPCAADRDRQMERKMEDGE